MTFEEARAQFPVFDRLAYLNAGTNGPLARATVEAVVEHERSGLKTGRGGAAYFEQAQALRDEARRKLAGVVGVSEEQLALTTSTTNGCNIVLAGLELTSEDEVVTTDGEHFGLIGALAVSPARVRIAEARHLPPEDSLEVLLREVTPRTKLIALSHVSWMTGNRFPAEALKEETGLPLLVDGAQSVGAIPVDAAAVDFYAFSCQKWLCGPDATGGLVVKDADVLRIAAPSYLSQERYEAATFSPRPGAPRFDPGWTPPPALAGLIAALDSAPEWRFERAADMAGRCRELLAERYEIVTAPGQATLVSFQIDGDSAEVVKTLYERGVIVRDVPGEGLIRVSCGWWTNEDDLSRLLSALG